MSRSPPVPDEDGVISHCVVVKDDISKRKRMEILPEAALLAAERLRQAVADVTIGLDDGETLAVSINLGVASIGEADTGIDDLLRRADAALYDANPPAASVCGNHRRRITRPSD
jgi:GGDEF domain-containing protein